MKNLTRQNPEQLFVAQELINKVKSKCCGIKVKHKISFDLNNGSGSTPESLEVEDGNYCYTRDLPNDANFSRTGYMFSGWSDSRQGEPINSSFKVTSDITLYAIWTKTKYTISFNKNGGSGTTPDDIEIEDGNYLYVSDLPDDSYFSRNGYTFKGWSETQDGIPMSSRKRITSNTTLYAVWKKVYTISFDRNNGSGTLPDDIEIEDGNYLYVSDLPDGSALSRSGYDFQGWSTTSNGEPISSNFKVIKNYTLYAIWTITKYTISFNKNGGKGTTPNSIEIEHGNYLYDYDLPDGSDMSKSGYKFYGWSESSNGSPMSGCRRITSNIILYALWKKVYTVSFDKNGGSGSTPQNVEVEDGDCFYNLPDDSYFWKNNYTFRGWFKTPSGSNDKVTYVCPSEDMILYARWDFFEPPIPDDPSIDDPEEPDDPSVDDKVSVENAVEYIKNLPSGNTQSVKVKGYLTQDALKQIGSAIKNSKCAIELDLSDCYGLTEFGGDAFDFCSNLVKIELPNSITTIGICAFYFCSNLESLQIPNSVRIIKSCAIYKCTELDLNIPSTVKAIGERGLYYVKSIKFGNQYNWYTTSSPSDWENKENGDSVEILTEDTYLYNRYYYKN